MNIKPSQAIQMLPVIIKNRLVPMLSGSPGIGKSQIVQSVANEYGLKVIDLRLAQCDPTDLMGFPKVTGNRSGYLPMETFPIEEDPLPDGYSGWLLFLDEFSSAPVAVQAAAYKLVLDRMVGKYKLHPHVAIVCAGNLETDNAIVMPMSTALQSRLIHLELQVESGEWVDWAIQANIDHRITDYIKFKPHNIYTFNPDHSDKTYACPRTWEFANRLLTGISPLDPIAIPILSGTLSEGVAREFISFCRIYEGLPKISDLIKNPANTPVPDEPSVLYAITGSLAQNIKESNLESIMEYVNRLPKEFQVICLRETLKRNSELLKHKSIQQWVIINGTELF